MRCICWHGAGINAHHMLCGSRKLPGHGRRRVSGDGACAVVGAVEGVLYPHAVGLGPGPVCPGTAPGADPDVPAHLCILTSMYMYTSHPHCCTPVYPYLYLVSHACIPLNLTLQCTNRPYTHSPTHMHTGRIAEQKLCVSVQVMSCTQ